MGRFSRFIVEYVGNLDDLDHAGPATSPPFVERRTNRHTRELVEWIKGQMEERGFPAAMRHEFVNDLRDALRHGDRMSDRAGEDERGYSRDGPT
jgi:hypothetical protein